MLSLGQGIRLPVCPFVTHLSSVKTTNATITNYFLSAARKTA